MAYSREWLIARYGMPKESPLPSAFDSEHEIARADEKLATCIEELTKVQDKTSCSVCNKIISLVQGEHHEQYLYLGHPVDLIESKCQYHPRLIAHLLSQGEKKEKTISGHNVYVKTGDSLCSLQLYHQRTAANWYELMEYRHQGKLRGNGLSMNTEWINMEQIRAWKQYCTVVHKGKCSLSSQLHDKLSIRPILLIDIEGMRIIETEGSEEYAALSYVWGAVPTLQTTKNNIHSLQQIGALAKAIDGSMVPLTIVHAIHIIKQLEIRYLWVDALCIVQDHETTKMQQIENMGSIFANAALTIIAAGGDHANHGISGIEGLSTPRESKQNIFEFPDGVRLCHEPSISMFDTKWQSRGWTYQEDLFSPRKLTFGGSRVTWKCRHADYREDFAMDRVARPQPSGMASADSFVSNNWPDIFAYAVACTFFNVRDFTYARDANLAFAGLCSVLCAKYDGGFLHGLPEMFFDVAILWQPDEEVHRRRSAASSTEISAQDLLPSWSWMGWQGEWLTNSWFPANEFIKIDYMGYYKTTNVRTINIIDWYTGSANKSQPEKRKIDVNWRKYAHLLDNTTDDVPQGWTRHPARLADAEKEDSLDKLSVRVTYKHDSDPISEFWWPVPTVAEHGKENVLPIQTDHLFFTTNRAWLRCARDETARRPGGFLRTETGQWAGYINFHNKEASEALPVFEKANFQGVSVELIAVSKGYALNTASWNGLDELNHEDRPGDSNRYEFYNVLWIKWDDEIAYRHGVGRVLQTVWEGLDLDEVDVVLG